MKSVQRFSVVALLMAACVQPGPGAATPRESELTMRMLAEAFETADTALITDLFWPNATYDDFANQATYDGIEEIVGYVTAVHSWGDDVYMNMGRVHAGDFGATGEWVFSAVQSRPMGEAVPEGTGLEVVMNGVTIIEMEGGLIRRAADYSDTAPMMLQLGGRIVMPGGAEIALEDVGN